MKTQSLKVKVLCAFSILLTACVVGAVCLTLPRVTSAAQSSSAYVELYSPAAGSSLWSSNTEYLTAKEEGGSLKVAYKAGHTGAVYTEVPLQISGKEGFKGYAIKLDVPKTVDVYSFTLYLKKGDVWQEAAAGIQYCLISTDGSYKNVASVWKRQRLNDFSGWLLLPKDTYYDPAPEQGTTFIIQFEDEKDCKRTQDIDITIDSVGYYTDMNAFLYEHASAEVLDKENLAVIDGYISKADKLAPNSEYQRKVKGKMLVYFFNVKENFKTLEVGRKTEIISGLQTKYYEFMSDYLYTEIRRGEMKTSFNVMSDVHITTGNNTSTFKSALDDMHAINPDSAAYLVLGDLSDSGVSPTNEASTSLDNYYDFIKSYNPKNSKGESIPVISIMGNHDVRGPEPERYPVAAYPLAVEMYKEREGVDEICFDRWINGYHFIMLNTSEWHKDDCILTADNIRWLDAKLSENEDGRPAFVLVHQRKSAIHTNSDSPYTFEEVIARHPSAVVLSGHEHAGFGVNEIVQEGKGTYINVPSLYHNTGGTLPATEYYYVEVYENAIIFRAREYGSNSWLIDSDVTVYIDKYVNNELFSSDDSDGKVSAVGATAVVEKGAGVSGNNLKIESTAANASVTVSIPAKGRVEIYGGYALHISSESAVSISINGAALKNGAKYYEVKSGALHEKTFNGGITGASGWILLPSDSFDKDACPVSDGEAVFTLSVAGQTVLLDKISYYFDAEEFAEAVDTLSYVFYGNGGEILSSGVKRYGETLVVPEDPEDYGNEQFSYSFAGWDTNGDGAADALPEKIYGDFSAVAVFAPTLKSYSYVFYDSDETTVLKHGTGDYGEALTPPEVENLFGWDTDGDGAAETLPAVITGNVEAVAIYSDSAISFSFVNAEGYVYKKGYVDSENRIIVPENPTPANDGEIFAGWDTNGDGLTDELPSDGKITEDFTAVALFAKKNPYKMLYSAAASHGVTMENVKDGTLANGLSYLTTEVVDHSDSPTGKVLKAVYDPTGGMEGNLNKAAVWLIINTPSDGAEIGGYAIWLDVPKADGGYSFSLFNKGDGTTKPITNSVNYTLLWENGNITKHAQWQRVNLPANFKGWMIIPTAGFYGKFAGSDTAIELSWERIDSNKISENFDVNIGAIVTFEGEVESFISSVSTYVYSFCDYDGKNLGSGIAEKGSAFKVPENPVREGNSRYTYEFAGWDTDGDGEADELPEKLDKSFYAVAVYKEISEKFTYKFVDGEGNTVFEKTASYNSLILPPFEYRTETENSYTYISDYGDYEEGMLLIKDVTFTVTLETVTIKYTVTFYDEDGVTVISSYELEKGGVITLPKETPVKAETEEYVYEFAGFDGYAEGMTISGDISFTAKYTATAKTVDGDKPSSGCGCKSAVGLESLIAVLLAAFAVSVIAIKRKAK